MKKISKFLGVASLMLAVLVFSFGSSFAEAVSYTPADVATHNTAANCWVIINNNVYNLTNFIPLHPGGSAAIVAVCGQDGTVAFNSGPHPAGTINAINSYLLGTIVATPVLSSLIVTPVTSTIMVAGTQQLSAVTKDQNSNPIGATLLFSSGNTAVATVDSSTGLVTGVSLGTTTITITAVNGSVTKTLSVVVNVTTSTVTPVLTSVVLNPTTKFISIGGIVQLTATPKDQNSVNFALATTTFSSSNTAVATVDSSTGIVTGVSAGTSNIKVTSVSGSITVSSVSSVTVGDNHGHGGKNHESDNADKNEKEDGNANDNGSEDKESHFTDGNRPHFNSGNMIVHYDNRSHSNSDGNNGNHFNGGGHERDN